MALNIKDPETLRLVEEVVQLTGENKTRAVRTALAERRRQLGRSGGSAEGRRAAISALLESEIWPQVPETEQGQPPLSREEREALVGIGPEGF